MTDFTFHFWTQFLRYDYETKFIRKNAFMLVELNLFNFNNKFPYVLNTSLNFRPQQLYQTGTDTKE